MKTLTKQEILEAACGKDERGLSKTDLLLENKLIKGKDEPILVDEVVINTASLNIFRNGRYVVVDVIFPTYIALELRDMWNSLQRFGQAKNSYDEESETLPLSVLTIVPEELNGEYYMVAVAPLFWALQNENPEDKYPSMIRMVFENEDFLFYSSEADEEKQKEDENKVDFTDVDFLDGMPKDEPTNVDFFEVD